MLRVILCENTTRWASEAAEIVAGVIREKANPVLILPTGGTPLPVYDALTQFCADGALSFAKTKTFNLDEYVGLEPTHEQSYRAFMERNLFRRVDIPKENTHVPMGIGADLQAQCAAYEQALQQAGGADLAVLGIGGNGHIGFNEPGTSFASQTHVVTLDERTRRDNARFFASLEEVPTQAVTMGLATILSAKRILLLVQGAAKADIVRAALQGPVTEAVPGSVLQCHADVVAVLDLASASRLADSNVEWRAAAQQLA
jgi:glucosamine-6-phosphate deaminase